MDKNMHSLFYKNIEKLGLSKRLTFAFLTSPSLYPETEGFIIACQDGVYPSLVYRKKILGLEAVDTHCRACKRDQETLMHLISACPKYAPNLYITRHDAALKVLYYFLRHMYDIDPSPVPPYKNQVIPSVVAAEGIKIFWNFPFSTTVQLAANKPDMAVLHPPSKQLFIIEMSCPGEKNVLDKATEKIRKYTDLLFQLRLSYPEYKIIFIPIIIGVLGGIHQNTMDYIKCLNIPTKKVIRIISDMQKYVILGSLRILRSHDANHPPPKGW